MNIYVHVCLFQVLGDIVEAVIGAVFVDCKADLGYDVTKFGGVESLQ
jgi:hypothetical protein